MPEQKEKPPRAEPDKEEVRKKQQEKRDLLAASLRDSTDSGGAPPPRGKKGKGSGGRRVPTPEEIAAVQEAINQLFDTIDLIASDAPTEVKKKATTDYLKVSARLAAIRYLPFLVEHIELFNLITAAGVWGGYRAYLLAKPMWEGLSAVAGVAQAFAGAAQPTEEVKETEAKIKETPPKEPPKGGQYGA